MQKNFFRFIKKHKIFSFVLFLLLLAISGSSFFSFSLLDFKIFENNKFFISLFGDVTINPQPEPLRSEDKKFSKDNIVDTSKVKQNPSKTENQTEIITPVRLQKIQVEPEEFGNQEIENNNDISRATLIKSGIDYEGFLATRNDIDFYKFELESPCGVNITLDINGSEPEDFKIEVLNQNNYSLTTKTESNNEVSSLRTGNLYLSKGTYYICVSSWRSWSSEPYTITLNKFKNNFMEAELNNDSQNSNNIPVNQIINASIGREDDIDYFNFEIDKNLKITPYFRFEPVDSNLKIYTLKIQSTNDKSSITFDFIGNTAKPSKEITPLRLKPGKYLVIVKRIKRSELDFYLHEYTLQINVEPLK